MDDFGAKVYEAFKKGEERESYYGDAFRYMEGRSVANKNISKVEYRAENTNGDKNNDEERTID